MPIAKTLLSLSLQQYDQEIGRIRKESLQIFADISTSSMQTMRERNLCASEPYAKNPYQIPSPLKIYKTKHALQHKR